MFHGVPTGVIVHFSSSGLHSVQSSAKIVDRKTEEEREAFHCSEKESREKKVSSSEEAFEKGGLDAEAGRDSIFCKICKNLHEIPRPKESKEVSRSKGYEDKKYDLFKPKPGERENKRKYLSLIHI